MSNILDKIREEEKYNTKDFLNFIEENDLLKDYVKEDFGSLKIGPGEQSFDRLAFYVVRQLNKDLYDEWCSRIREKARQCGSGSSYEYYLAFCMSNRDRLTEALYIINTPDNDKEKK